MVCDFDKSDAAAGLLDQRYTVRYPFSGSPPLLCDFRSFSARVFCAYNQPSTGTCPGAPNAREEETESRDPRGDPEGCADWNGPGVRRYRRCVECNSTVVDRESQKVWLKHPHQGPKWPKHSTYRE